MDESSCKRDAFFLLNGHGVTAENAGEGRSPSFRNRKAPKTSQFKKCLKERKS